MIYVLFIVTHVYGGSVVTTQEFLTEERCMAARAVFVKADYSAVRSVFCVQK